MLQNNDAALVIGDVALKAKTEGLFVYDLAAEWRSQTGNVLLCLPFGQFELPPDPCSNLLV